MAKHQCKRWCGQETISSKITTGAPTTTTTVELYDDYYTTTKALQRLLRQRSSYNDYATAGSQATAATEAPTALALQQRALQRLRLAESTTAATTAYSND